MSESIKKSIRYFLPESTFVILFLIVLLIIFGGINQFSALSTRFVYAWIIIHKAEQIFPVAWDDNQRTATPLMDALLVPYHRKQHCIIQIVSLCLLFYVPQLLMNIVYVLVHQMPLAETVNVFVNHLCYSMMFLICVVGAEHVISKGTRLTLQIFSIFWGLACGCIFTELLIPNLLIAFLPIVLIILGRRKEKQKIETPKTIQNNLFGILKLSKMHIIKERPVAESIGYGISFFWMYRLIQRTILLIGTAFQNYSFSELLDMNGLILLLIPVTLTTSIGAIKRIYTSKNMLRIIPVKKKDLFTAAAYLGLRVPVVIQLISVMYVWIFAKQGDFSSFFSSTHPVEIIIHGLFLAVLPTCIYLFCFIVHAREDRFVTAFLIVLAMITAAGSYMIFNITTGDAVLGKAAGLLIMTVSSHLLAWTSYHNMQNIHS